MEILNLFTNKFKRTDNHENTSETKSNKQYSLHDGEEIYNLVLRKIDEAQSAIFVAASWFTDKDLLDALLKKYDDHINIDIKVILDNNKDNFYLPFKQLTDKGGIVKIIKKASSYGRMHNKFCIIDEEKLISGSYNWSKNARTNNDENIIYTEDEQTVVEFLDRFNSLLEEAINFDPYNLHEIEEDVEDSAPVSQIEENISNYEKLITELIYSQVHSYNDEELHELGNERCKCCAGDAENLSQELDNVYTGFLRDLKVSNDKKELIKSNLYEQLERSKGSLELQSQSDISLLEKENRCRRGAIDNEINNLKSEIVTKEAEIDNLKSNKRIGLETKLEDNEIRIKEIISDNYRPKIPLYTFIPNFIFLILVSVYSVIFYSSAAYILIYSQDDAKEEKLNGVIAGSPEIFDGNAIFKAYDKGLVSLLFIILVPIFIMGLIFVINKVAGKWRYFYLFLAIVFIDVFTAYKVAESIHNIEYIKGQTDKTWDFRMVLTDTDFYLIFVFGLLALLTFELLLSHIFKVLDNRNQDIKYDKSRLEIEQLKEKSVAIRDELNEVDHQINLKLAELGIQKENISALEIKISEGQVEIEQKKHGIVSTREHQKLVFENITNINLTKIDNENFTFSAVYVKDRVSVFMRGWKDFLYEQFAVKIAVTKSREADEQVKLWKLNNLKQLAVDN
ncbi:phospholipase D-like domain-containing protein [Fulvivirgaceae bacterium BMA12]|uniref:phospholipase D n=1 Tax=Agaribacillus aureus TaxID=3051825 RepID=A0ABT8LB23_9BACT|nr:phospholipase D-like domain-containing protein [Fulvivirgaceae bacterium BMA12]